VFTSVGVVCSYAWAKFFPIRPEVSFEDWVSNRFGRRLLRQVGHLAETQPFVPSPLPNTMNQER
jgi:hypothetical protein